MLVLSQSIENEGALWFSSLGVAVVRRTGNVLLCEDANALVE